MDLLDLLPEADGGTGRADHQPVVHIITPDFATLCRLDYLEARELGDRCPVSPHRPGRLDKWTGIRWRNITCPWCRSLGRAYYRAVMAAMNRSVA